MNNSILQKRIPTLLGILLIMVGLGVTSFLVQTGVITIGQASPAEEPQNIRVTNITDTSFSVSYVTTSAAPGVVSTGDTQALGQTVLDDRDQQSGAINSYKVHHVTIRNLKQTTKYYFSVVSGRDTYLQNGQPYEVVTGATISTSPTSQEPLSGKVTLPNGTAPAEALIYATATSGQTLSVLLKSNGTYVMPMNAMRTTTLTTYVQLTKDTAIQMLIVNGDAKSSISILASQVNPVPLISLSSDYNFIQGNAPIAHIATNSALIKFPTLPSAKIADLPTTPQISTPKKDQGFTDAQPLLRGTATPNSTVTIAIHSDEQISDQVKADATGNWSYRPSKPLSPGKHTITITAPNSAGIMKTITQSFTVHAAGSQVSQTATPSATPTLKTPTSTPTPTATTSSPTPILPSPTPTPTIVTTPTPTPIALVPTGPSPTTIAIGGITTPTPQVLSEKSKGSIPAAGDPKIVTAGILAVVLTGLGLVLFFLSRGSISSI